MFSAFLLVASLHFAGPHIKHQWLLDQNERRCMVLRERTADSVGVAIETRPFETFHRLIFLLPKAGGPARERSFVGELSVPHPRPIGKNWVQVSEPPESPDRLVKATISGDQLRMAATAQTISITSKKLGTVTASLPGLTKVFGALRDCEDSLAKKWGKPRTWATPAIERTDVRNLVRSGDYPSKLIMNDIEGGAAVLLKINEAGNPAGCFAHEYEGEKVFAAVVCAAIIKRGKFEPARDQGGKAVSSYYLTPFVRFVLE
jgi:hypothetical protein